MARRPASASTGMTLRYRKDQLGLAMQEQYRLTVRRAGLHVCQSQPAKLGVLRLVREVLGRFANCSSGVRSTLMPTCCHERQRAHCPTRPRHLDRANRVCATHSSRWDRERG